MRLCKKCFKKSMWSGQAFTRWKCNMCGLEDVHGNTGVPKVCIACSVLFNKCQRCEGKISEED